MRLPIKLVVAVLCVFPLVLALTMPFGQQDANAQSRSCASFDSRHTPENSGSFERLRVTVTNVCDEVISVQVCIEIRREGHVLGDFAWVDGNFTLRSGESDYWESYHPRSASSFDVYWIPGSDGLYDDCD